MLLWGVEDRETQATLVTRCSKDSNLLSSVSFYLCPFFGCVWLLMDPPQSVLGVTASITFASTHVVISLFWQSSQRKIEQKKLPFKAQGSKSDSITHSTLLPGKPISAIPPLPSAWDAPASSLPQEEMNFPSSTKKRERAAAWASPSDAHSFMHSERNCHK